MKKTTIVNQFGREFLKKAIAPALLMAIATISCSAIAASEQDQKPVVCPQAQEQALEGCHSLEGTWLYSVTIPEVDAAPVLFQGTETYAAGGGYVEADQLSFTPGYLATAGHGAWQADGSKTYLLTYINLTYDSQGNATGSSKVRQTMKLTDTGTKYDGWGDFFYYDLNGNVVGSGTFTVTAKKIAVEHPKR